MKIFEEESNYSGPMIITDDPIVATAGVFNFLLVANANAFYNFNAYMNANLAGNFNFPKS